MGSRTVNPCPTLNELPPPPPGKTGWPWTEVTLQLPGTMPDGSRWPRVSIVTPSLNQGQFIEETIRSVLLQGYPNLEYIIIDGGSTDKTVEIIEKYEPWLTYWISEPDRGQSQAINKGWRKATGSIIAYLNSDDTYLPDAIKTAANYFTDHADTAMFYGSCNFVDEESNVICPYNAKEFDIRKMQFGNYIAQPSVFLRDYVVNELGYLDESLHFVMDYDMWIRIGLKCKVGYTPNLLSNFRMHESAKTSERFMHFSFLSDRLKVADKFFHNPELPECIKVLRKKVYRNIYIRIVKYHVKSILLYIPGCLTGKIRF